MAHEDNSHEIYNTQFVEHNALITMIDLLCTKNVEIILTSSVRSHAGKVKKKVVKKDREPNPLDNKLFQRQTMCD